MQDLTPQTQETRAVLVRGQLFLLVAWLALFSGPRGCLHSVFEWRFPDFPEVVLYLLGLCNIHLQLANLNLSLTVPTHHQICDVCSKSNHIFKPTYRVLDDYCKYSRHLPLKFSRNQFWNTKKWSKVSVMWNMLRSIQRIMTNYSSPRCYRDYFSLF